MQLIREELLMIVAFEISTCPHTGVTTTIGVMDYLWTDEKARYYVKIYGFSRVQGEAI